MQNEEGPGEPPTSQVSSFFILPAAFSRMWLLGGFGGASG
jgi:hypothetical protein